MHTHVSAITAVYVFLMVAILGGLWRLSAAYLAHRDGFLSEVGRGMAAQF